MRNVFSSFCLALSTAKLELAGSNITPWFKLYESICEACKILIAEVSLKICWYQFSYIYYNSKFQGSVKILDNRLAKQIVVRFWFQCIFKFLDQVMKSLRIDVQEIMMKPWWLITSHFLSDCLFDIRYTYSKDITFISPSIITMNWQIVHKWNLFLCL